MARSLTASLHRNLALLIAPPLAALNVSAADWKPIWADEFEGAANSPVDAGKWTAEVGGDGWGNQEWECYTADLANAHLDGKGHLIITALKGAPGQHRTRYGTGEFSSARFITKGKFTFLHGRVEARIQVPLGKGFWPAFWMLGSDIDAAAWPQCGEVDIVENVGQEPATIHGTIHGPGYSGGGGPTGLYRLPEGERFGDDFHVYTVEWEEGEIRWFVDGHLYETRTPKDLPPGMQWVFDHPFFLLLNLSVGGDWPGPPDEATSFPAEMKVDYIRVYQR